MILLLIKAAMAALVEKREKEQQDLYGGLAEDTSSDESIDAGVATVM